MDNERAAAIAIAGMIILNIVMLVILIKTHAIHGSPH